MVKIYNDFQLYKTALILLMVFCLQFISIQSTQADTYVLADAIVFEDLRVLVTTEGTSRTVISASLPQQFIAGSNESAVITIPASGVIADPETGCMALHFHGVLNGVNDPSPAMCGQGRVIRIDSDANRRIIQDINALIEAELSTVAIFISGFNDVARGGELSDFVNTLIDVNTDINNHLEILNNIGDEIQQAEASGEVLSQDATDLLKKVTCAIKSDSNAQKKAKVVREEFEELIDRGAEPIGFSRSDRSRIVRRILAANRCKEGIINIIAKLEEKDD